MHMLDTARRTDLLSRISAPFDGCDNERWRVCILRKTTDGWQSIASSAACAAKYFAANEGAFDNVKEMTGSNPVEELRQGFERAVLGDRHPVLARKFSIGEDVYLCLLECDDHSPPEAVQHGRSALKLAVDLAVLEIESRIDELTKIGTRGAMNEWLRECSFPAIVFCDLDDFKQYNDGPAAWQLGDGVLRLVGRVLSKYAQEKMVGGCIKSAKPFRWGGDEFVIACELSPTAKRQAIGDFTAHAHGILRDLSFRRTLRRGKDGLWGASSSDVIEGILEKVEAPPLRAQVTREIGEFEVLTAIATGGRLPLASVEPPEPPVRDTEQDFHELHRGVGVSLGIFLPTVQIDERKDCVHNASIAAKSAKSQGKAQFMFWDDIKVVVALDSDILIRERFDDVVRINRGAADGIRREMLFDCFWTCTEADQRFLFRKGQIRAFEVRSKTTFCRVVAETCRIDASDHAKLH